MKVLAIFSLVLAVATSYPVVKTWTLSMLEDAIRLNIHTHVPYLEVAVNEIMSSYWTGNPENEKLFQAVVPSPTGRATWTVKQLKAALADPATSKEQALLDAKYFLEEMNEIGNVQKTVVVAIPAVDISTWTPEDLIGALRSPTTKSALKPYLEKAITELKEALEKGETRETQYMVTPVGLIPSEADYDYLSEPLKNLVMKTKMAIIGDKFTKRFKKIEEYGVKRL